MHREKFNNVIKSVSSLFDILSNPDRVRILGLLLNNKELDVNEIHERLNISQSRVSQHLKLLKLNFLVEERREGKHVFYHIKNPAVSRVVETALQFQALTLSAEPELMATVNELIGLWHI